MRIFEVFYQDQVIIVEASSTRSAMWRALGVLKEFGIIAKLHELTTWELS